MADKNNASELYTDANVLRIIAAEGAFLTLIVLVTGWQFPAFLLAGDFALRTFTRQSSPLVALGAAIADATGKKPQWILAAPKKIATLAGFLLSVCILGFLHYEDYIIVYSLCAVLLCFTLLESLFKICLGCYLYNLFVPVINNRYLRKNRNE